GAEVNRPHIERGAFRFGRPIAIDTHQLGNAFDEVAFGYWRHRHPCRRLVEPPPIVPRAKQRNSAVLLPEGSKSLKEALAVVKRTCARRNANLPVRCDAWLAPAPVSIVRNQHVIAEDRSKR